MSSTLTTLESRTGTSITQVNDLDELLQVTGFNFQVEKASLYDPEGEELPNTYLLRRSDTHAPLNVVRGRYQIVSNREMLEPFDQLVRQHGATYETAGSVRDGRVCWVSARLPGDIQVRQGDVVQKRIVGMVYHDGTRRNSYCGYTTRVACNNQLSMLSRAARGGDQVGHVGNWRAQLELARVAFDARLRDAQQFEQQSRQLVNHAMNLTTATRFVQAYLPINTRTDSAARQTRISRVREELLALFVHGAGNVGDSRWDMLNAVTEWYDHHARSRARDRFFNEVRGAGASTHKTRAFNMLLHEWN